MSTDYQAQIEQSVRQLFENIRPRMTDEEMQRIQKAYEVAYEAHKPQVRKSGEPYIIHPVSVARIVGEELELDANTIIAAFLHDVVEDTPLTIEDIQKDFGEDVAFLVKVVTKQKKEKYDLSKQVDNYLQILSSIHYDIRALLVKLSDRLHNMRTLSSMKPEKQMKIAGETDYFYAPLANRLGMYKVKCELEDLSFKYRCPEEYERLSKRLKDLQDEEYNALSTFAARFNQVLNDNNIETRTEIHFRSAYSVWRKMQSSTYNVKHVEGRHFISVVYSDNGQYSEKDTSLWVYSLLTNVFKEQNGSLSNYINAPKENGYQGLHVRLLNENVGWEEVHICSERMARFSRLGCTAEQSEGNVQLWLKKFRAVLQDLAVHSSEISYMDGVTSSFYNDDIMVFSTQGKGVILPKKSTALDYAFELGTDTGIHAKYARINGKLLSVRTILNRGDIVEIHCDDKSEPMPEWLSTVTTYKAKRDLKAFFMRKDRLPYNRCSICNPLPNDEVVGFRNGDVISIHRRNCPSAISMASQQGDSIMEVQFEPDSRFLYPVHLIIRGIDRHHWLQDIIYCITEINHLSLDSLKVEKADCIVEAKMNLCVHSRTELRSVVRFIEDIDAVDEVFFAPITTK